LRNVVILRDDTLKKMIYVVGAILLFCSFQFVIGETEEYDYIYVDDDNNTGPWDGSMENPYRCIQDAVENASEGDTVFVFNGFYSGNIRIDKSLDLVGEDSRSTIVDGGKHIIWIFADSVSIQQFNLTGSSRFFSAIYVVGYDAFISSNNINSNYDGIKIDGVSNATVLNNTFINNYNRNIRVEFSSDCLVSDNYIGGDGDGIYVWSSSNNRIIRNTLDHCDLGILLGDFCYDNFLYHNNLIRNDFGNAADYTTNNRWDNGYPSGGNFWDDYTGLDTDNDGIGDTAYEISEEVVDHYPLINPIHMSKPDVAVKSGFGFHAELVNKDDHAVSGLLTVNIYRMDDKLKSSFDSMIVNLSPSSGKTISKNMFGFGLVSATVEFGIWEWEQDAFLIGPIWINI